MLGFGMEIIGAGVIAVGAVCIFKKFVYGSATGRKRAVSFSSQAMLTGAFPPKAEVWAPIINIVFYFETAPLNEKLKQTGEKLLFYDRFRSVVVMEGTTCRFEECEVDVGRDLISSFSVADDDEMIHKVDDLCSKPFDCQDTKPLWRFIRIENKKGKSGVLIRIHHSLGDGISLIGAIGKVFQTTEGLPYAIDIPEKVGGGVKTNVTVPDWIKVFFECATLPNTKFDSDIKFTSSDKKHLAMKGARKTITMPTLKLDFLKMLKNSACVTINDVMLSLTAGTIRRYCVNKGDPLLLSNMALQNRALMPVAFPRPKIDTESPSKALRNLWSFVSTELPMKERTVTDRLKQCATATKKLKCSPMAYIQLWLQNNIVSRMPQFMQRQVAYDVFSRHSLVFSNLPGPAEHLTFADEKLLGMHCIFPNLLPQVIIISYAGDVFFALNVDPDVIDTKEDLPKLFLEEVEELAKAFKVDTSPDKMFSDVFKPAGY
jgi:diacylglycerol O-acyltransferase